MKKFIFLVITVVGLSTAVAIAQAKYDIKQMTPEVKAALDGRRARFEELKSLKSKGDVGENNHGYVEALNSSASAVVDAENSDRRFIYQTIVQQNSLPSDSLSTVEKVFAQVQRDKASSGDKIQTEDGSWTTK